MRRWVRQFGRGLFALGLGLVAATIAHPLVLGGGADAGKVEDGRYFVGSAGHRYTEVSGAAWRVSRLLYWGFPWLPLLLIWTGGALGAAARERGERAEPGAAADRGLIG
jgi:hypothetical protein